LREYFTVNTAQYFMLRQIIICTLALVGTLSVAIILINPEGHFDLLIGGSVSVGEFLIISALFLPTVLCHAGPMSIAIATTYLYSGWLADREIVSLRAAGLSEWSIARPGIAAAALLTVLTACVTIFVLPLSAGKLFDIVYVVSHNLPYRMLKEGSFNPAAPGISFSFRTWHGDSVVNDVTIYDRHVPDTFRVIRAESASFITSARGDMMVLQNGTITRLSDDDAPAGPFAFRQLAMPLDHASIDASSRPQTWFEQQIWRLLNPPADIDPDSQNWSGWVSEGHQRIITPMLCLNYVLLSLGILLRVPPRVRTPIYHLAGVGGAVALLHIGMVIAHSMVVRDYYLLFAFYSFAVVPAAIGVALLWSGNRKFRSHQRRVYAHWGAALKQITAGSRLRAPENAMR
jgi:lipopolysaccharide export system permease protein